MSVFTADFSMNHSGFIIICETSSPLLLLVWVARTKLNFKKKYRKFFIVAVDFGVLRKRDEKHSWTRHNEKNLYLRTEEYVHSGSCWSLCGWTSGSTMCLNYIYAFFPDQCFSIFFSVISELKGKYILDSSSSRLSWTGLSISKHEAVGLFLLFPPF